MSEAYNKAWDKWLDECGEEEPDHEDDFSAGWSACQEEVLKTLKQDWTGADLSINSCDQHYIEKVKEL